MEKQDDDKGFTWVVKNFSSSKSENIYSDRFIVGRYNWRLRAFPTADHLSLNLEVPLPDKNYLPHGWRRHAKFSLTLVNQFSEKLSLVKETQHWFDQKSPSFGYAEFITVSELQEKGFLMNVDFIVIVKIDLLEVVKERDVSQFSSQLENINRIFEIKNCPKNQYLKKAHMNFFFSFSETLSQSPPELSNDDISAADDALAYLRVVGFNVDWLEKKLDKLKEKKKKEDAILARLREMEEKLQTFKKQCLDLEAQIEIEKKDLLAVRDPLSLDDDDLV